MPYGSGKRLGETIDPRLMMADFSGFERAGQIMGQGFANTGKQIGDTIKQRNENEKEIAGGIKMAAAMKKAVPELSEMADEVINNLSNADLSTREKLIALSGVKEAMQMSLLGNQERRADVALKIQQDELAAEIAADRNKSPQGTFMTREEFSSLANSGIPVKGVPTQDGRIYVTDISGNQPGILGSNVAMVDGKPTRVPIPQINLPSWGAGANIQNALPQGQGGMFPDNVPTTGLPIGEADVFTPGVSVDGTPGVLPPKEQPVIPAGEVPKGDVFSVEGGQVGVTRLPGSTAELEYRTKAAELKAKEEKTKSEQITSEQAKTASEKQKLSKSNFLIDKANEAENIIKNDISKYGAGTIFDIGKSKLPGTPEYSLVNQILPALKDSIALSALQKLKETSPTGSSGLGSLTEKEGARLENMYGVLDVGGDKEILLKDLQRLKEEAFDMVHGSRAERQKALKAGNITKEANDQVEQMYNEQILGRKLKEVGSTPLDTTPEVEQVLKELGL